MRKDMEVKSNNTVILQRNKAKKILLNHNMLQRLKEIRKLGKKAIRKKKQVENNELNIMTELVTLATLAKSDLK